MEFFFCHVSDRNDNFWSQLKCQRGLSNDFRCHQKCEENAKNKSLNIVWCFGDNPKTPKWLRHRKRNQVCVSLSSTKRKHLTFTVVFWLQGTICSPLQTCGKPPKALECGDGKKKGIRTKTITTITLSGPSGWALEWLSYGRNFATRRYAKVMFSIKPR